MQPIKVLFVCLGNICRSPMAEYLFRDMVRRRGLDMYYEVASAATSHEEEGNAVYPAARKQMQSVGIDMAGKYARVLTRRDYDAYDYIVGMETRNVVNVHRICGGDPAHKVTRLLDWSSLPRDIEDPWYTGNFDAVYKEIYEGCTALLDRLEYERNSAS